MKATLALAMMNEKRKIGKWILAALYSLIFLVLLFCLYAEKINEDLSNSMIRLHIVANSNSDADQSLKYRVRDAIVEYMNRRMDVLGSKESAGAYVNDHLEELEAVANRVIAEHGAQEQARVTFGKFPFPTKRYANVILPAGFYDALKVEIGRAEGENWWCVMFPPLCFVEDTKGEMQEEYMGVLKDELSDAELDLILASETGEEIPVEIRFKIVELFQNSKIKLAGLFRSIIKFE